MPYRVYRVLKFSAQRGRRSVRVAVPVPVPVRLFHVTLRAAGSQIAHGRQPVLASAQFVDPIDIPRPDVYIDSTYRADDDDRTWADGGISNAENVELTWPQEDGLQPTKANLQYESDAVVATEDKRALAESIVDFFADKDFAQHMCDVLNYADI